jgi:type IV secretory pathway TrbF-like protein
MSTQPTNTPIYQDQLIAWHNQRLWYLLCGAGAIIVALAVAVCILIFRPHTQPWVIEVDSKGEPVAGVTPLAGSQPIAEHAIRFELGVYVQDAFSVSPNFQQEQTVLSRVYAMSSQQAAAMLTGYYHRNQGADNPLMVGSKYWEDVRVLDTMKLAPKDLYQVDYIVYRHAYAHPLDPTATNWRATMRVLQGKATDKNPLGIYIDNLDMEPEAK